MDQLRIWEVGTGKLKQIITSQPYNIADAVFSPDGTTLATIPNVTGSGSHVVSLWNAQTGKLLRQIDTKLTGEQIKIAFSPDASTLAAGSEIDKAITLWRIK